MRGVLFLLMCSRTILSYDGPQVMVSLKGGDVRTAKWLLDKTDGKARQMVEVRNTHLSHEECLALLK